MTIYTIGFTKRTAEQFFEALKGSGAKHLLDVRLSKNSQLAGFTKRNDLPYFLKHLVGMEYHEVPMLAPEESIFNEYSQTGDWARYEKRYLELIRQRGVQKHIHHGLFEDGVVLLCSEPEATHCHRRLAAEYLAQTVPARAQAEIVHL